MRDVESENSSWSGVELRSTGRNAYERLHIAIKSLSMAYQVSFQWLLGAVEQSRGDMCKGVHAVICDTPYVTPRIAEL